MFRSNTLDDLVESYKAARKSGDSNTILSAEAAINSFAQGEAMMMTMRVNEAVAARISGFNAA